MEIGPDEDDEFTDIREQIFHNTVREQIVSVFCIFQIEKRSIKLFRIEPRPTVTSKKKER